jgi:hypothetical protein
MKVKFLVWDKEKLQRKKTENLISRKKTTEKKKKIKFLVLNKE